jgi:hypothetical protein
MPLSFNGIGTRYYGRADESDRGSYTATEWIIFLWLPIVPLRSWRVSQRRKGMDTLLFSNAKYLVRPLPLSLRQVVKGYLCTLMAVVIPVAIWLFVRSV